LGGRHALESSVAAYVYHGDDPDIERPGTFGAVVWVGSVKPDHMADGDFWEDVTDSGESVEAYIRADGTRPFAAPIGGVDPVDPEHLTTQSFVNDAIDDHTSDTFAPHGATTSPNADSLMRRGATGQTSVTAPTNASHVTTKTYVDNATLRPAGSISQSSTGQSVPHNTIVTMEFNNTDFNIGGVTQVNNNRLVAPRAGLWVLGASSQLTNGGNIVRLDLSVNVNGSSITSQGIVVNSASTSSIATRCSCVGFATISVGDEITATIRQFNASSNAEQISAAAGTINRLWGYHVRDL
jgi:hypothetical protein